MPREQVLGARVRHVQAAELLEGRSQGNGPVQQAQLDIPAVSHNLLLPTLCDPQVFFRGTTADRLSSDPSSRVEVALPGYWDPVVTMIGEGSSVSSAASPDPDAVGIDCPSASSLSA